MEQIVSQTNRDAPPRFACPFGHEDTACLESLSLTDLESAWKKRFGIDVGRLFASVEARRIWFCQCSLCRLKFFAPAVAGDGAFYKGLSGWYDRWPGHVAGAE